jgi:membrane peptidoglycan carboxypeptidase
LRPWVKRAALTVAIVGVVGTLAVGGLVYSYAGDLPSLDRFGSDDLAQGTRIYAHEPISGDPNHLRLLEERYKEHRIVVPLEKMARPLRQATVAIEDRDFYSHRGVNPVRIASAFVYDVSHGRAAQGGSTITQQVIKSYVLGDYDSSRSLSRKIREFLLAVQLESRYDKDRILETYLNNNFYGNGAYGIETAAQSYFDKHASDLTVGEASFLAGLPQRPTAYDPFRPQSFARARVRQRLVLDAMVRERYLSRADADRAFAQDLSAPLKKAAEASHARRVTLAPHFVDYVLANLEMQYDAALINRGGLTVITTLDTTAQLQALAAVKQGVDTYRKQGANNGALLAVDVHTGAILAMVGSADFSDAEIGGQVNITTNNKPPGSTFKPYTYLTALLNGFTPASILDDAHGVFGTYKPRDWDGKELGPISLRQSLAESRNISSVRLFRDVGMDNVFATARRLGITTPLQPYLTTALGSQDVHMIEHVAAYSAFANGGLRVRPFGIEQVSVRDRVLSRADMRRDTGERVVPAAPAYLLTDILKDAVSREWKLNFPVAGKSGTTEEWTNSWYMGYTTDVAVGTWVGRTFTNPPRSEGMNRVWGESGGGTIWREFLKAYVASHGKPADWVRPAGIQSVLVCKAGLRADHPVPDQTRSELFLAGTEPKAYCPGMEPGATAPPVASPHPSASDSTSPIVILPRQKPSPTLLPTPSPTDDGRD